MAVRPISPRTVRCSSAPKPELLSEGPVAATAVKDLILDHVFASVGAACSGGRHDPARAARALARRGSFPPRRRPGWTKSAAQMRSLRQGRDLYLAVSLVTRKVGKADLTLSDADLRDANASRAGWDPREWSVDQAARVHADSRAGERIRRAWPAASISCATPPTSSELVAFYRGLPLYPEQPRYVARATEGLRTNMKSVFEAIAHRNPYPSEQFPEAAWNQMVLKALFVGSALWPIVGLDRRANPELARMLCDYAHERWAAGRPVSPELWRCVGPATRPARCCRIWSGSSRRARNRSGRRPRWRCTASPDPARRRLLERDPALAKSVARGDLSWERLVRAGLTTDQSTARRTP